MNKTLYVSDLDGTLLRSNQTTSEYTNEVINSLTEKGIVFSYATARSIYTSSKVTKGLDAKIPVITYNGAFIVDNCTHEVLHATYFDRNVYNLLRCFNTGNIKNITRHKFFFRIHNSFSLIIS